MSNYYITAHNKSKKINIPLEEKHKYFNQASGGETGIQIHKTEISINTVHGYTVTKDNIHIIFNTNNLSISQGTEENQRIGNKIALKSIDLTTFIYLSGNSIINKFSHSEAITTTFNFRIMCVKFDQIMTTTDLANWYQQTYIYYYNVGVTGGGTMPFQSNWMDKLRESTPWTGAFKILYDKKFTLGKNHTTSQMNISLPIKGNINFDNTSNRPTDNQEINNTYTFIIGPSNNYLDCDCISQDKMQQSTFTSTVLAFMNTNIKVKYYDM